jgi:hypothetical protein
MPRNVQKTPAQQPNKKKQRNRRRSKKQPKVAISTTAAYTLDTVSRNLQRRVRPVMRNKVMPNGIDYAYAHCRLHPFGTATSTGIPDGSNVRRLVFDHKSRSTINCLAAGGVLDIQFIPALPAGALYRSTTNPLAGPASAPFTVDGYVVWDYNLANGAGGTAFGSQIGWQMGNIYQEYAAWALASETTDTAPLQPVPGQRARVVSIGWRIMYVGQPVLASGYYTVTAQPAKFDNQMVQNSQPLSLYQAGVNSSTPGNVYPVNSVYTRLMNFATTPFGAIPQQNTLRIDQGACGVLRSDTSDHSYLAHTKEGYFIEGTFAPNAAPNIASAIDLIPNVSYGTVNFWDDRFDPVTVRIQGMSANTSLIVETVACVEYEVDPTSIMSRVAAPSPPLNTATIQNVGAFLRSQPLAKPVREEATLSQNFMKFARTAMKVASYSNSPMAPLAGTINTLAEMFGDM